MPFRLCCLVVDGHTNSARLLANILKLDGHAGITASSVEEATRIGGEAPFDVLLTDLRLPDGLGWDLLARLRQRQPGLVGIAVSGVAGPKHLGYSGAVRFALHLTKPIDVEQLREALTAVTRQVIREAALRNLPMPAGVAAIPSTSGSNVKKCVEAEHVRGLAQDSAPQTRVCRF